VGRIPAKRRGRGLGVQAGPVSPVATIDPLWTVADRRLYAASVSLAILCTVLLALFPCRSDDIFMHLALGRRFFLEGGFPRGDPFLYAAPAIPANWLSHWGARLGAYLLYEAGGWNALVVAKTLLVLLGRRRAPLGRVAARVPLGAGSGLHASRRVGAVSGTSCGPTWE